MTNDSARRQSHSAQSLPKASGCTGALHEIDRDLTRAPAVTGALPAPRTAERERSLEIGGTDERGLDRLAARRDFDSERCLSIMQKRYRPLHGRSRLRTLDSHLALKLLSSPSKIREADAVRAARRARTEATSVVLDAQ